MVLQCPTDQQSVKLYSQQALRPQFVNCQTQNLYSNNCFVSVQNIKKQKRLVKGFQLGRTLLFDWGFDVPFVNVYCYPLLKMIYIQLHIHCSVQIGSHESLIIILLLFIFPGLNKNKFYIFCNCFVNNFVILDRFFHFL